MLNIILNWTIRLFLSNPLFLEGHVRFTMGFFTVFLIINTGVHTAQSMGRYSVCTCTHTVYLMYLTFQLETWVYFHWYWLEKVYRIPWNRTTRSWNEGSLEIPSTDPLNNIILEMNGWCSQFKSLKINCLFDSNW